MPAIAQVFILAEEGDDLAEAISEQMITLNARHWDTSTMTLLRVLAWLRRGTDGASLAPSQLRPPQGALTGQ